MAKRKNNWLRSEFNKNNLAKIKCFSTKLLYLVWQNFTRTSLFFWSSLTGIHPDKPKLLQQLILLQFFCHATRLKDRKNLIQKTDFMSKFGRIYSWTLLPGLLTPLCFMSFDWLPFVKASCDWPARFVSGTFWGLFVFAFLPSELQFMFQWRISCHMHFLSWLSLR